jgi:beta-glucosidase
LKQQGLEPIVTLQHFTIPVWLAEKGGWLNPACQKFFLRYVEKVVEALCEEVTYWVSINEPLVYVYHAYIIGVWPPQERSFAKSRQVTEHLLDGHCSAYSFIHALYKTKQLSPPKVSIAKNMQYFMACKATLKNSIAVYARNRFFNFEFIEKLIRRRALDFIGLNYYTRSLIDAGGFRLKNLLLDTCDDGHDVLEKNSLGWEIFPEGLYRLLMQLKRYGLPVFILENGICTEDDGLRWRFIREHLAGVHRALQSGVNVLGYVYWSLIDNYEWDKGFGPRFGLIEMDYATYNRKIRESARKLSLVCRENALDYGTDQ